VVHGFNGFTIEKEDYEKLAKYIIVLLENEDYAKKLSLNARKTFEEKYHIDKRIKSLLKIFSNLARVYAEGGEIFIPKMKAFNLADLAYVLTYQIAPFFGIRSEEIKVNVIGLLRGEKMHEVLLDESELPYLYVYDDFYILKPNNPKWSDIGKQLIISSNFAEKLTRDELKEIVQEYITEIIKQELFSYAITYAHSLSHGLIDGFLDECKPLNETEKIKLFLDLSKGIVIWARRNKSLLDYA
jgi:hypothetical protein